MMNVDVCDKANVLVMAVGSPLGQSILKAVLASPVAGDVHVADIGKLAAGLHVSRAKSVIFPLVKEESYFSVLSKYIEENEISVIFPTIAAEHEFFAKNMKYFNDRKIAIVSCSEDVFEICNDKYLSMVFLRNAGVNAPETVLCSDLNIVNDFFDKHTFPVVLKPRFGASSNDVYILKNKERLMGVIGAFPADYFVLQEFIDDNDDYTAGVFAAKNSNFKDCFVIKRNLKFGLSYSGEVIDDSDISSYCLKVSDALNSYYSINVQFKLKNGIPCVYEINPRLSSTTSVRAHFGFNEPDMIIRDLQGRDSLIECPAAKSGYFMRYWEEVYLEKL